MLIHLHRAAVLASALCLSSSTVVGQLSGKYTIDPKGTGTRNFIKLIDASVALVKNGVNGPVTFTVADGTYTSTWYHGPISGTSAREA